MDSVKIDQIVVFENTYTGNGRPVSALVTIPDF
jgi:hypothetical protein